MNLHSSKPEDILFGRGFFLRIVMYVVIIITMSSLNAIVDAILHPDIPYFDAEHLIVGGLTALLSIILFGLLTVYEVRLNRALAKTLESFLPICSHCKKVRKSDMPAEQMESWQPMEVYIEEQASTKFSHGICPECLKKLYPDVHRNSD